MGLRFEFAIDKCPPNFSNTGWVTFPIKEWPQRRQQTTPSAQDIPSLHAAQAFHDAGDMFYFDDCALKVKV